MTGVVQRLRGIRLRDQLSGASPYPLGVLSGIFFIDQFDLAAFTVLAPEIAAGLNIDATTFGYLFVPQLMIVVLLPLVFGILGDRISRVKLTVFGAGLWAVSAILTGLAPSIFLLGLFRVMAGVAKGPSVVHLSLLTDYYPTSARGYAFAVYNFSLRFGQGVGLLVAGLIGELFGWRAAFFVLAVPGLLLVVLSLRMREPVRGYYDAIEAGETEAPTQRTLGPVRAARLMLKTPAFKRLCFATALYFGAVVGASVGLSFYYSAVFNVGPALRGLYDFIPLPISLVTLLVGGAYAQRWLAEGRSDRVARFAALTLAAGGVGFMGLAFAPTLPIAVFMATVVTAVGALAGIPLQLLVSRLIPAHIRSQGFGLLVLFQFSLTPITALYSLGLGDAYGFRVTILAFVPMFLLGAAVTWTVGSTSKRDIARLQDVALAQVHARRRAAEGIEVDVLDVTGIDAGYGNVQILFGVDFKVGPGEIVALLGTNGAGKSTLLRVISGLLTPTAGTVLLEGEDVTGLDAEVTASRGLIQVPGGRGIFPGLTVERNLELGAYLHWNDPDYVASARAEVLQLFPRLGERLKQPAGTLSGGEQQMLTLAQALVSKPQVLMIDELSLGLAPVVVQELLVAVRQINERGTPIVLVEQSVNIALALAHRAYFLEKGEVRFEGEAAELLSRTDLLRSIFIEGAGAQKEVVT